MHLGLMHLGQIKEKDTTTRNSTQLALLGAYGCMWIISAQKKSVQRPQLWGATTQKERRARELPGKRDARKWLMCLDDVTQ